MNRWLVLALALLLALPTSMNALSVRVDPSPGGYAQVGTNPPGVEIRFQEIPDGVEATIIRDEWGVPHIYADDLTSLMFGNGYAQAQDRMIQMDILRHVGKGEAALLLGEAGLEMDLVTRRELYTHEERLQTYRSIDPLWREAFDAFAKGVNAWIDEFVADPSKMPSEYPALGFLPEPWEATDTLAVAEYLLDVFGRGAGGGEAQNAQMLHKLRGLLGDEAGAAAFDDIVWGLRTDTYTTIKADDGPTWDVMAPQVPHDLSDLSDLDPAQLEAYEAAVRAEDAPDWTSTLGDAAASAGIPMRFGSNAQVVAGEHTATGKPIVYGGPQMSYFAPMIPYELGLHGAGFDAVGMGIAGAPGVIIGRGPSHSWTVTSGSVDQVDMVVEKLVAGEPNKYIVDGEVLEMDCRIETHTVRPGPLDFAPAADPAWRPPVVDIVEQEVCRTIHGPVLARTPEGDYAFASYRSFRLDEARSGTLWLQMGQSRSIEDMQDILETFRFTFNFNAAEESGKIAYLHVGAQPIRDDRLDPRLPTPGWDSSYDWKGILTGRDLPHVIDAESGYTVNWNNNPAIGFHTGDTYEKWGSMQRAELMDQLLTDKIASTGGALTIDDVRQVHFDASTRDPYGDEFHAVMRTAAADLGETEAVEAIDEWAATGYFYGGYADYDGMPVAGGAYADTMPAGMKLYELWRSEMQALVFNDELGSFVRELGWNPPDTSDPHAGDHGREDNKHSILDDALHGRSDHGWCDNITTDATETCAGQAMDAMQTVLADNPDWNDPQPNRISRFFALGALPAFEIPMTNRPSHQAFYDWGLPEGPERSRNALPPGASGHLNTIELAQVQAWSGGYPLGDLPGHTADQLQMYIDFEDKPLLFTRESVEAFEESRIIFG